MVECVNCAKFKGCNFSNPYLHECVDYQETQTNEQWIKQCTTEQLAEFLNNISLDSLFAGQMHDLPKRNGTKEWVEWLKQPHTKE